MYSFSSNNIYFAQKEPIKIKFLRLSSVPVKFCQIPHANFEMMSPYLSKFCIPLQFSEWLLLCTYLAQKIYTVLIKSPLKWKSWRILSTQVNICQIPYTNFETTSQFLSKFCSHLQFHGRLFLCTFLGQTIYTLLKRSPFKWKFLRLSSAIPHEKINQCLTNINRCLIDSSKI